ncbi:MAG: 23S rRNA (uracil(1939)-C(5))-methyltransferase RlmD [Galactobacillus timonensis]|uniref:23S rRNA (uracil(1939)-C(5))-methyltransferase RlmD n=1 Tax=Galactobacillus timonensis TaxID=2041840 RepID=UPI002409F204|nr:23S rRNA (uracil(1939)-C(5))-methyltransferase RlmD [Galactobacillus timonensis]MDD6599595.1 23S rRNA (uracil(1939)-C(5))-methyltransferase RlmD [Galactobacillus timonensis]
MNPCPYRKQCGSCSGMNEEYDLTLKRKREEVRQLTGTQMVEPVIGMKDPTHYRCKVFAAFHKNRRNQMTAGMYEEESHTVVPVIDCAIQHPLANKILQQICHIADSMHLDAYDEDRGTGTLRYVYIRVSHALNKAMVVIVIGSRELPGSRYFVQQLHQHCPDVSTIVLNWNHGSNSMVLGPKFKTLWGPGTIEDRIGDVRFRISPQSFYQVNPEMTQVLYQKALEMAKIKETDTVLDACCGIGTISLLASRQAKQVVGVEVNAMAVQDAITNARINGIHNARFYAADAGEYLEECGETFDVVLMDPPRSGLSQQFCDALLKMKPQRAVYVSCNPETLGRDLKILGSGYQVKKIVPVDQFPWTKHVETVVLMSKVKEK